MLQARFMASMPIKRRGGLAHRRALHLIAAARRAEDVDEESLLGNLARARWSSRLTADRNFSTGFIADRDYRNEEASSES